MRSIRILQGFVLLSILMVPVLIIVFLKTMGNNQYDIPVLYENGVENPFRECEVAENTQHYIPEFELVTQDSTLRGSSQMQGKITIVDFFFTSCPSICPIMSTEMERVDDAFRNNPEVQI